MPYVITLLDPAGEVPLATAEDCVEEILLDGQPLLQAAQALRAETVRVFNRGNRSRTLTFRVKRKPAASPAAALRTCFEHERLLQQRRGNGLTLQ